MDVAQCVPAASLNMTPLTHFTEGVTLLTAEMMPLL